MFYFVPRTDTVAGAVDQGDKETFLLACQVLDYRYTYLDRLGVGTLGYHSRGEYFGTGMMQEDPRRSNERAEGEPIGTKGGEGEEPRTAGEPTGGTKGERKGSDTKNGNGKETSSGNGKETEKYLVIRAHFPKFDAGNLFINGPLQPDPSNPHNPFPPLHATSNNNPSSNTQQDTPFTNPQHDSGNRAVLSIWGDRAIEMAGFDIELLAFREMMYIECESLLRRDDGGFICGTVGAYVRGREGRS